ncbi:MAG: GH3 auxin-responsive promoter family protein, partial [Gemmatimonadetes bacterium]|nr:GH3 auxin-responsive promoter family protein [Gemmatimonadota bacterium]
MSAGARIASTLYRAAAAPASIRFARALREPGAAQAAILRRILHENRDTEFGRAHGFAGDLPADPVTGNHGDAVHVGLRWNEREVGGRLALLRGGAIAAEQEYVGRQAADLLVGEIGGGVRRHGSR